MLTQIQKTTVLKSKDIEKKWYIIDAEDVVLGRLAAIVATRLKGKHKPSYTPFLDCGDNIVIINAEKVKLTGKKLTDKIFYWHTGWAGGIKQRTAGQILNGQHPERVIQKAVERMLPKGVLGKKLLKNLRVYAGTEHPHKGQEPETIDLAALNPKNKRSAQ